MNIVKLYFKLAVRKDDVMRFEIEVEVKAYKEKCAAHTIKMERAIWKRN